MANTVQCQFCGVKVNIISSTHADDVWENGCVPCRERWKRDAYRLLATIEGIDNMLAKVEDTKSKWRPDVEDTERYPWGG
jgi:hypothetical protein